MKPNPYIALHLAITAGQIDDACIFDKALSADEVKWLVANTFADL